MPFCEDVTRAALEMLDRLECYIQFDFPRHELGSVWAFPRIMIRHSLTKVGGMAM
jgi:hypothetical protein